MNVAILVYFDLLELDMAGPLTIWRTANRYAHSANLEPVEVFTVARSRASIKGSSGLVMTPTYAFAGAPDPDLMIVPGGPGAEKAGKDPVTRDYLRHHASHLKHLGSVSSGANLLGEAGLLEGLSVTSFGSLQESLWQYRPNEVLDQAITRNPNGWLFARTSGEGMAMALELVSSVFSNEVAVQTANHLRI